MCCGWSRREEKLNTHTHTHTPSLPLDAKCVQSHEHVINFTAAAAAILFGHCSLVTDQLCKMTLYRYSLPLSPSTHIIYEKRNNGGLCSRPLSTIRHQYQPLIMAQQPVNRFVVAVTAWEVEFVGPFGTTSCYD